MPVPKLTERYTVQDYLSWSDGQRWELIDGRLYSMSPSPSIKHQEITGNIYTFFRIALRGRMCRPYMAPTDVIFSDQDVVQPDVFIVCDPKRITEMNIQGAPDLIFEILSPSTGKKDQWEKKRLYETHGVKEYILVDPDGQYINRFLLGSDGLFDRGEIMDAQETLKLNSILDIEIPLQDVFTVEKPVL